MGGCMWNISPSSSYFRYEPKTAVKNECFLRISWAPLRGSLSLACWKPQAECGVPRLSRHTLSPQHCRERPRSMVVIEVFTPVVQRILKHNMVSA